MKKTIALILCILFALTAFAACAGDTDKDGSKAPSAEASTATSSEAASAESSEVASAESSEASAA